ncbi:MAG: AbrB/MazE/SpoVT family DNA-binding domain-containing protein [Candidatus Tectomicrobia bacterium]
MLIRQLGKRRNLIIPPEICHEVGLQEGDFVELQALRGTVVIKPKKLVDAHATLTPENEVLREADQ